MMRKFVAITFAAVAVLLILGSRDGPKPAEAASYFLVTNSQDSGPGSFRAAIDAANSATSGPISVMFVTTAPIRLDTGIGYLNTLPITLQRAAWGQTVVEASNPSDCIPGLFGSAGSDVTIKDTTFRNTACSALVVESSTPRTGTIKVRLQHVVMSDVGTGAFVTDHPYGANTSVDLRIDLSSFEDAGAAIDMREEGSGDGALTITATSVRGSCVSATESGTGNLEVQTSLFSVRDCPGNAFTIQEFDEGNLRASFAFTDVRASAAAGLLLVEQGSGNLGALLASSNVSGNHGDGVFAQQSTPGYGSLGVFNTSVTGNTTNNIFLDGVVQY